MRRGRRPGRGHHRPSESQDRDCDQRDQPGPRDDLHASGGLLTTLVLTHPSRRTFAERLTGLGHGRDVVAVGVPAAQRRQHQLDVVVPQHVDGALGAGPSNRRASVTCGSQPACRRSVHVHANRDNARRTTSSSMSTAWRPEPFAAEEQQAGRASTDRATRCRGAPGEVDDVVGQVRRRHDRHVRALVRPVQLRGQPGVAERLPVPTYDLLSRQVGPGSRVWSRRVPAALAGKPQKRLGA